VSQTLTIYKSKWSREIAQAQVLNTAFIDGREICFLKKIIKYCQYTMTAIQMIERLRIRSKFKQLLQVLTTAFIGREINLLSERKNVF